MKHELINVMNEIIGGTDDFSFMWRGQEPSALTYECAVYRKEDGKVTIRVDGERPGSNWTHMGSIVKNPDSDHQWLWFGQQPWGCINRINVHLATAAITMFLQRGHRSGAILPGGNVYER